MRTIRPTGPFTDQGDLAGMTRTLVRKYIHRTLPPRRSASEIAGPGSASML